MIYPATYNIAILQNATWRASFRVTQNRQTLDNVTVSGGTVLFALDCHGLSAGNKAIFTVPSVSSDSPYISLEPSPDSEVPCGLALNAVYYVIASRGCALASPLELWLPRNDDCCILYELFIKQINQAFEKEIEPLVQIKRSHPFLLCCCRLVACSNAS